MSLASAGTSSPHTSIIDNHQNGIILGIRFVCACRTPPFNRVVVVDRWRNWIDLPPPLDRITFSVEINTP
ncbi:uncharacterized protein BO88DRAFT_400318 [Aspergillus vadensis CBS 113365]|uniref:Uncharacterized protein n=1 Tax=Aspergillus vadensis (strain CBS 113365 / IMI 142717 / IBT 24658) TaxID=1448311 RepID=A0A319CH56_ASPVC|nr:hypothetical protein BO88DRAFT_400318 [Aspergillus vadensis CBS 113365]PYH74648.1 hypothetical protein BO88DRAFT_400318 [Aspergillus vadensis CBS 113365]